MYTIESLTYFFSAFITAIICIGILVRNYTKVYSKFVSIVFFCLTAAFVIEGFSYLFINNLYMASVWNIISHAGYYLAGGMFTWIVVSILYPKYRTPAFLFLLLFNIITTLVMLAYAPSSLPLLLHDSFLSWNYSRATALSIIASQALGTFVAALFFIAGILKSMNVSIRIRSMYITTGLFLLILCEIVQNIAFSIDLNKANVWLIGAGLQVAGLLFLLLGFIFIRPVPNEY